MRGIFYTHLITLLQPLEVIGGDLDIQFYLRVYVEIVGLLDGHIQLAGDPDGIYRLCTFFDIELKATLVDVVTAVGSST